MRIAVLTPPRDPKGRPDLEDTFVQAEQISNCIDRLGHESFPAIYGPDRVKVEKQMDKLAPDLVFNLVEDVPEGPDKVHLAALLLEKLRLRYTGCTAMSLEALGDKQRMKQTLIDGGLPVALSLAHGEDGTRYIVKSAIEHSSLGISEANVVTGRHAAETLIAARQKEFGGTWFAETYIDGREFNLSVLETLNGPLVLPPAEILFLNHAGDRPKIVGYEEKWSSGSPEDEATPRVFPAAEAELFAELGRLAISSWRLFAITGYARIDFRVDSDGRPYILELNANPCLTADAGFCAAAKQAGMSQTDVVAHLLAAATS